MGSSQLNTNPAIKQKQENLTAQQTMLQSPTPADQTSQVEESSPQNVAPLKNPGQKVTRRELEKEEKLQQKLRYLQFYEAYEVEGAPESWKCSACSEVQVTKQTVVNGCKDEECSHAVAHKKKVFYEKVLEWSCADQELHIKEWQRKRKNELRSGIQKAFQKEENGWVATGKGTKDKGVKTSRLLEQDFNVTPKQQILAERTVKDATANKENEAKPDVKNSEVEVKENYHSENCKTCVRMEKLMGNIMPHPINV